MFIRTKSLPNSPRKTIQIVESVRNGKSVSQRIVQYIGVASDDEALAKIKLLAKQVIESLEQERKDSDPQRELFTESELQQCETQPFEKSVDDDATVKIANLHGFSRRKTSLIRYGC